ncbi:MAG: H-NS histone family protein [Sphaerotilus natans subsp. sulfidivorans]|nr:H-NS histone family protein [Sphaerotilus sulfidivorans]
MVDSQEECDWDAGYRAGSDELAQRCADAERRGRVIAQQQGGSGRYAAGLVELTGSAIESGPVAEAYKRGYTSGQRVRPAVRYRCPETGQTWTGRGLPPKWIVAARDAGRDLAEFATGE